MIPRLVHSIWLSEEPEPPALITRCLKTHEIPGYERRMVTLDNCFKGTPYIRECLAAKKWAKAADYLRMHYLYEEGGIYLDADAEVLKPLDQFLDNDIFACEEENGFVSNAIVGSVPRHPIIGDYLGKVERNFKGGGDLVFQPGMFLWTEVVKYSPGIKVYPPEFFLPYNHHLDRLKLTENSHVIHHFAKSWVPSQTA